MASGSPLVLWGRKNLAVARILLADDQRDVLEALRILLKSEGYQTEGVTSLSGIFHALEKKEYALLLMDLNYTRDTTSGQEGLSAIPKIQEIDPTLPIVLITGENGTGKSLIAQAIHALSPRTARTMITVNMGGLSETLFESELFGHVKGAFTDAKTDRAGRFELADESTLFMDEIANIPLAQQAKLLRVIETGDFERVGSSKTLHANVRIISATNANLESEIAAGRFRQDLLFRLNTIEIELPPLRDRREDIMPLANSFLRQHTERYRKQVGGFDENARERLLQHRFPGNIRELDHVVERAVLMTKDRQIRAADLGLTTGSSESRNVEEMSLEEVEAFLIKKALARNDGNARKAAEALGLSRSAFYRRLQQYGL